MPRRWRSRTIRARPTGRYLGTTALYGGGLVNEDTVTGVTLASDGAAAAAPVAAYPIAASAATGTGLSNYTITYTAGTLTVDAKALAITANDQSKTYGTLLDLGTTAFTVVGLVNEDTVTGVTLASDGAAAAAPVAAYPIAASAATGTGLSNYTIAYTAGTLTVDAKALAITANDQSKTYGTLLDLGTTAFTVVGLVNEDTVTGVTLASDGAAAAAPVAAYPIAASAATGTGLSNYTITYTAGTLTVDAKALAITANDQSKTYGTLLDLGTTAFTVVGLVNEDTVTGVTLASDGAAAAAPVAAYPIAASAATGTGLSNYTITYTAGTLTVDAKALAITANDQSKTYGTLLDLGTTAFTVVGLVNEDTVTGVTLASDGAAAAAPVAAYPIAASAATGTGLSNYTITYTAGTLTVDAKALAITANDQSKTYGTLLDLGTTAFTVVGLVNEDTVTGVTLASDGAAAAAPVAAYPIAASAATGTGLSNYTITYTAGTLTVDAKALAITANDQSKTYGTLLDLGRRPLRWWVW
jgi:mucin-19